MKEFQFLPLLICLGMLAGPVQAESTLEKYLKRNTQPGSGTTNTDAPGVNQVYKSPEGYWRLDDTRSEGGFCAITYITAANSAGYIGASAQGPEAYIVFSGPSIAPTEKTTRKQMTLLAASDGQVSSVHAFHMPYKAESGIIMFSLTTIQDAVNLMSDAEEIGVEMDKKKAFSIKWKGGHAARTAMQGCLSRAAAGTK